MYKVEEVEEEEGNEKRSLFIVSEIVDWKKSCLVQI